MPYRAPIKEMAFYLDNVLDAGRLSSTERFSEATSEMTEAILGEAARMAEDILAPLNVAGDLHPAKLENGVTRCSPGFDAGYKAISEGGWVGMAGDPAYGGMGLPLTLMSCVNGVASNNSNAILGVAM